MMFGLGFLEIVVIIIIMILVNKPEDLPKLLRKIGQIYGQLQRFYYTIVDEINNINPINPKK